MSEDSRRILNSFFFKSRTENKLSISAVAAGGAAAAGGLEEVNSREYRHNKETRMRKRNIIRDIGEYKQIRFLFKCNRLLAVQWPTVHGDGRLQTGFAAAAAAAAVVFVVVVVVVVRPIKTPFFGRRSLRPIQNESK